MLLLISLIYSWFIIGNQYEKSSLESFKNECDNEFNNISNSLKLSFNRRFSFINGLKAFTQTAIIDSETLDESDKKRFDIYTSQSGMFQNGIINASIAPNGIQTFILPENQAGQIVGHNLYEDQRPEVSADIDTIFKTKEGVISGPYQLRQGGYALVARAPIIKDDSIYGLVNMVINFNSIMQDSNIRASSKNLNIAIRNESGDVFFGNPEVFNYADYAYEISYPNGYWVIRGRIKDSRAAEIKQRIFIVKAVLLSIFVLVSTVTILTLRKNLFLSDEIEKMIFYDTLTNLPNRRSMFNRMNHLISDKTPFYLVFADLDNFKNINDTMGHSLGDEILKKISSKYSRICATNKGNVYRWGGDEFLFIIEKKNTNIEIFISSILSSFKEAIHIDSQKYFMSASIGVASFPDDSSNIDDLIKHADTAMYRAKHEGKNRYMFFDRKMASETLMKVNLEKSMREAIPKGEFTVYYQPKIDIVSMRVVEVEALIRWLDPAGSNIPPNIFIPIAEESGMIEKLFDIVLSKSILDIDHLNSYLEKSLRVSVNLSFSQFNDSLIPYLENKLESTGFSPSLVDLEITEGMVMKNPAQSSKILEDLRRMGVSISLDDFGTGYSSLNHLAFLPIDTIKIDKSFIQKSESKSIERKIVKSIIDLSSELDISLVAEGVETKEQLDFLRSNNCRLVQGYYFAPPLPFGKLKDFLEKGLPDG